MKTVYVYVQDTLADWEAGYAVAELHSGRFFRPTAEPLTVKTCALARETVRTMGGFRIWPDLTVDEICLSEAALLILPGSDTWLTLQHEMILEKAADFLAAGIPVAAICAATVALGRAGLLNRRRHTSNDLEFLRTICGDSYAGMKLYEQQPAVIDGDLITAAGTAPLEFARHIFERLDVFSPATLAAWYGLHKEKQPMYYDQLMASLAKREKEGGGVDYRLRGK
jgi:putative intracellular protease/amidase